MSRLRSHLSYANVMATIAVFVALGGTSYAVSQLPRNSVGTKQLRSGAVGKSEMRRNAIRSKHINNRSVALRDISRAARASLRGQAGPQGPPGPSVAELSAAVRSGGAYSRSRGTAGPVTTHDGGSGLYKVDFDRDVTACYAVATLSKEDVQPENGEIVTTIDPNVSNSVFVRTRNSSGAPQDLPFHLIVVC